MSVVITYALDDRQVFIFAGGRGVFEWHNQDRKQHAVSTFYTSIFSL